MALTYAQLQKQIEQLQRQADAIRSEEVKGVVDRIKVAIAHYGLTADQLGLGGVQSTAGKASPGPNPAAKKAPKVKGKMRFSDKLGNAWTGMGPKPAWLREALAAGHDIGEFRIGNRAKPKKSLASSIAAAAGSNAKSATTPATVKTKRKSPKLRYADDAGHSWSGMGPRPGWLKDAIDAGKKLADFAK